MIKVITKEIAIHNLYALKLRTRALSDRDALDLAINALEQQPCEDCKVKKEAYIQGYDYGVKDWFKSKSQPCEDCVSREDALKAIEEQKKGFYGVERYAIDECHSAVMKLPSVRPYKEIVEDKRACEKCIHYVTRDSRGVVLCGCDSWECDFEEVKT
jgi:hypothetical protein